MTSTPTTSGPSEAELRSFVNTPRPFKNPSYTKSTNRRTRTLKQILAAERDAAMGIDPSNKKSKAAGGGVGAGGRKLLTGAAAAAARRRDDFLAASAAPSGTATPAEMDGETSAAMTDLDVDAGLASALGTGGTQTPAVSSEAEALRRKRRELPTYASIEAPPSLRPRKKFCDITGLIAPYTDPKSGLRYHSVEMYEIIKTFGPGVDQSYLTLRGDNSLIK